MNEPKKLYRIEQGAKLFGVCGGIAEYFNIDANLVRLIWVVLSLLTVVVTGVVLYLIAALLLPKREKSSRPARCLTGPALLLPKKSDVYPGY